MSHPILELQAAETMADQLKHRREKMAERDQVQAARNELIRWYQSRTLMHQRLDELGSKIEQSEVDSHEIDEHRTRLEAQLRTVIAPREAEALQSEISGLVTRRSELDDVELTAMEEQTRIEDDLTALLGHEQSLRSTLLAADAALAAIEMVNLLRQIES